MPTVAHVRVQQGYRPLTRRKPALAGARGLGGQAMPLALAMNPNTSPMTTPPDPCAWWDGIWPFSPSQACQIARAQQQIQSVANNAAYNATLPNAPATAVSAAQVAQDFATQQEALVPGDVASTSAFYGSLPPGAPSTPWYVWAVIAVAGYQLLK